MRRLFVLVLLFSVLGGCGQSSFVGRRFDNFTAYYNKFFNARKAFDAGLKALEERDTRIDRSRYLPLFTNPDAAASSSNFQDTIKKSADVLREHPNSKWVDDALLLIGKSYFYQRNYIGAEQKFLEVIALDTELEDEAQFWLARTLITGENYDEAARSLTESLNREDVSRRWKPKLQLALGELFVQRGDWESAAETLAEGLEAVRDSDLGARAQFLLGQIYETLGDYERAHAAYARVERFRPLYELSYAAKLSAVRVQGSYLDEEAALRELRRMERDDKHYQYRNELAYIRGRIYQMQNHPDDAFYVYDELLYDADGDVATVRPRVHYALAELYRDAYRDFLTASAHFDTAATQLGTANPGGAAARPGAAAEPEHFTPEAITDATDQRDMFASFSDVMFRINEMDSLLYLGSLDDEAFDEAILEIRRQLAAEMEAQQRELERRQANQAFRDAGAAESARAGAATSAAAAASGAAGFLYHRDPMLVEEARLNFETVWGERPLVPNWRRREAVNSYLASVADQERAGDSLMTEIVSTAGSQLPHVDLFRIPRDSLSRAAMRADRAAASYEVGNVLFLAMNRPDSAAAWYRMVIEDANDSTLMQRAYYALAEVQHSTGDEQSARELYQTVIDISDRTELGRQIGQRLGRVPAQEVEGDTLAAARAAYERAYFHWQRGNYRAAISDMIEIACLYPDTEVAPKALMAAGMVYSDWAREDSLDILGGMPVSVPDSLLENLGLSVRKTRVVPDTSRAATPSVDSLGIPVAPPADSLLTEELSVATDSLADVPSVPATDSLADVIAGTATDALAHATSGAGLDSVQIEAPAAIRDSLLAERSRARADSLGLADAPSIPGAENGVVDSLALADGVPPDTVRSDVASDRQGAAADSLRAEAMAAAVDSIIVEEYEPIDLERLYASITENYAGSPFAERASDIRRALAETRRERAAADSLARASADSLARAVAGEPLMQADSLSGAAPPALTADSLASNADSLAIEDDSTAAIPATPDELSGATPDSSQASSQAEEGGVDLPADSSLVAPEGNVAPDDVLPDAPPPGDPDLPPPSESDAPPRSGPGRGAPADSTAEPVY